MDVAPVFAEMHGNPVRAGCQNSLGGRHNVRFNQGGSGRGFVPGLAERRDVININAQLKHGG